MLQWAAHLQVYGNKKAADRGICGFEPDYCRLLLLHESEIIKRGR